MRAEIRAANGPQTMGQGQTWPILPVSLDACAAPTERAADVRAATAISLLWAACASADAGATCLAGRTAGAADAACLWQHRRRGSRGGRRAPSRRLTTFS